MGTSNTSNKTANISVSKNLSPEQQKLMELGIETPTKYELDIQVRAFASHLGIVKTPLKLLDNSPPFIESTEYNQPHEFYNNRLRKMKSKTVEENEVGDSLNKSSQEITSNLRLSVSIPISKKLSSPRKSFKKSSSGISTIAKYVHTKGSNEIIISKEIENSDSSDTNKYIKWPSSCIGVLIEPSKISNQVMYGFGCLISPKLVLTNRSSLFRKSEKFPEEMRLVEEKMIAFSLLDENEEEELYQVIKIFTEKDFHLAILYIESVDTLKYGNFGFGAITSDDIFIDCKGLYISGYLNYQSYQEESFKDLGNETKETDKTIQDASNIIKSQDVVNDFSIIDFKKSMDRIEIDASRVASLVRESSFTRNFINPMNSINCDVRKDFNLKDIVVEHITEKNLPLAEGVKSRINGKLAKLDNLLSEENFYPGSIIVRNYPTKQKKINYYINNDSNLDINSNETEEVNQFIIIGMVLEKNKVLFFNNSIRDKLFDWIAQIRLVNVANYNLNYYSLENFFTSKQLSDYYHRVCDIELSNNQIEDLALELIVKNFNYLEVLNVNNNMVGNEGVKTLISSQRVKESLRILRIRSNRITDEAIEMIANANLKKLTCLNVIGNSLTQTAFEIFKEDSLKNVIHDFSLLTIKKQESLRKESSGSTNNLSALDITKLNCFQPFSEINEENGEINIGSFSELEIKPAFSTLARYHGKGINDMTKNKQPNKTAQVGIEYYFNKDYNTFNLLFKEDTKEMYPIESTSEFPYSCIGSIYIKKDSNDRNTSWGSGVLIRPNIVLTAAHNLYKEVKCKGSDIRYELVKPNEVIFTMGHNGNDYLVESKVIDIYIGEKFTISKDNPDNSEDYALLILENDVGYKGGFMGISTLSKTEIKELAKKQKLYLCGYPVDHSKVLGQANMYEVSKVFDETTLSFDDKDFIMYDNLHTSNGLSGGPLYYRDENGNCFIISIHKGVIDVNKRYKGRGVFINQERLKKIKKYIDSLHVYVPSITEMKDLEFFWKEISKNNFNFYYSMKLGPIYESLNIDCRREYLKISSEEDRKNEFVTSLKIMDLVEDPAKFNNLLDQHNVLKGYTLAKSEFFPPHIDYVFSQEDVFEYDLQLLLSNNRKEIEKSIVDCHNCVVNKIHCENELEYLLKCTPIKEDFINARILDNELKYDDNFIRRYYNVRTNPSSSMKKSNDYNKKIIYSFNKCNIKLEKFRKTSNNFLNFFKDKGINKDSIKLFFTKFGYFVHNDIQIGFRVESEDANLRLSNSSSNSQSDGLFRSNERFCIFDRKGSRVALSIDNVLGEFAKRALNPESWVICSESNPIFTLELLPKEIKGDIFEYIFKVYNITSYLSHRRDYTFKILSLADLKLSDEILKYIEICNVGKIVELDLSNNNFNYKSLETLNSIAFNNLKILRLNSLKLEDLYISADIISRLEILDLKSNLLSVKNSTKLFHIFSSANLDNLKELNLSSNNIEDTGISLLSKLVKLKSLDLSKNMIGMVGINYLSEKCNFPELEHLNLGHNKINYDAIFNFKKCRKLKKLRVLDLRNNLIDNAGARILSEECNFLKNLNMLILSKNPIQEEGQGYLMRCQYFSNMRLLEFS